MDIYFQDTFHFFVTSLNGTADDNGQRLELRLKDRDSPLPHRAAGLATARKVKERSCRLSPVAVDVNHQLLVLSALTQATPVEEDCLDPTWRRFKGCLGALDGTYIEVTVPESEKAKYRTRKGKICTNVLGVCNREMGFVYVLSGWEGSASDSRVLRDAITHRNSLKIPHGNYYLVDAGYTNGPDFLAPYRGTRYHVREWAQGARAPRNHQEYFNRVHSSARNIIERCFGLLKKRWSILRSPSFYPLKTQSQIIIACCLLQNFIRKSMGMDPEEEGSILDEFMPDGDEAQDGMIDVVENTNEWTHWRDNIATEMYEEWHIGLME
ncbi:uncharacterized protein LOC110278576 [Arachis duranensis]|uniref:Uncharacterized protein LOC110278576 n=1 Tax=Arachis duranensis TaxID=130453 RepID=A0A6P5NBF7_ARADU|nr:uncharacterized protein LOC110278576 [Arachis duranensis]